MSAPLNGKPGPLHGFTPLDELGILHRFGWGMMSNLFYGATGMGSAVGDPVSTTFGHGLRGLSKVAGFGAESAGRGLNGGLSAMGLAGRAAGGAAPFAMEALKRSIKAPFQLAKWGYNANKSMRSEFKANRALVDNNLQQAHIDSGLNAKDSSLLTEAQKKERALIRKYGREEIKYTDAGKDAYHLGARKFGARTAGEHMRMGVKSYLKNGLLSPIGIGINTGLAFLMSGDDITDPKTGAGAMMARNLATEAGFFGGGTIGAAIGALLVPGSSIAAGVGYLIGGFKGASLMDAAVDKIYEISEIGHKYGASRAYRKSTFIDSDHAATMRQRAMQSIYKSQMSARSAFGGEALIYHA